MAADDIDALDRVLFRLATLDDEKKFVEVIDALLPKLLDMLSLEMAGPHRSKVLEVLSHINKRVKDSAIPLPVGKLLMSLRTAPTFRANFLMVYIKMGMSRLQPSVIDSLWPSMACRSLYPESARDYLLHSCLSHLQNLHVPPDPTERAAKFSELLACTDDVQALSTAMADTLLFVKPAMRKDGPASSPVPGTPTGTLLPVPIPPGLSTASCCRITGAEQCSAEALAAAVSTLSNDTLYARKRAIMRVASSGVWGDRVMLRLGLAGLSDFHHDITAAAEDLLRRAGGLDVEEQAVIDELFRFILGTPAIRPDDPEARSPAPMASRLRALTLLTKSKKAASAYPAVIKVVFECWFGGSGGSSAASTSSTPPLQYKLQQSSTRLAQMSFQLVSPSLLAPLAPLFIQGLLRLITLCTPVEKGEAPAPVAPDRSPAAYLQLLTGGMSNSNPGGSGLTAILESRDANEKARTREAAYAALGTLAARAPSAFVGSSAVPKALFTRLAEEEADSRLAVAEALSSLSTVYSHRRHAAAVQAGIVHPQASEKVLEEIRDLMDSTHSHPDPRVRLTAVEWAAGVFPFTDVRARYTCCLMVASGKNEVREAARAGLRPYGKAGHHSLRGRFAGADGDGDRGNLTGIARRGGAEGEAGVTAAPKGDEEEDGGDVDVLNDEDAFRQLARLYPLFQSLVRFSTSLTEEEEEAVVSQGQGEAGKRKREDGQPGAGDILSGIDPGVSYIDQPDGSLCALGKRITSLPCLSLAALIELANTCLDASAITAGVTTGEYITSLDSGTGLTVLHAYRSMLEYALTVSPAEADAARLHETAAACLARLLAAAPHRLCAVYASRPAWMLRWLSSNSAVIRRSMAQLLGTAATALPLATTTPSQEEGAPSVSVLQLILDLTKAAASTDARTVDIKHGAVSALGQVLGRSLPRAHSMAGEGPKGGPGSSHWTDAVATAVSAIVSQLAHPFALVREAATGALAAISREGPLPLPVGDMVTVQGAISTFASTSQLPGQEELAGVTGKNISRARVVLQLFALAIGAAGGSRAEERATTADEEEGTEGKKRGAGVGVEGTGSSERGSSSTEAAAVCLGAIAAGEVKHGAEASSPILHCCIQALLALSINKYASVQFAVAAALVEACGGPAASMSAGVVQVQAQRGQLAADEDITTFATEGGTSRSEARAAALASSRLGVHDHLLGGVLQHTLEHTVQSIKPVERASAAVWLLTLAHALGRASVVLQSRLPALQASFSRLLSEKSQFVQEVAGKGVAVVYDISPPDSKVRQGLVHSLLDTFNTGKKVGQSVLAATAGSSGGVGADPQGSASGGGSGQPEQGTPSAPTSPAAAGPQTLQLSAAGDAGYRELCAMANEAGQPDLIYRFLALAGHHAVWHARGGAGVGLEALLRSRARTALAPHLAALIPKLFRYQYDPSPRVREPMERLWSLLVRDPKRTVAAHMGPILADLTKASESAAWRERQAACAGLADLLPGRAYGEVCMHLESLWRACLRAIDDVKDSVREAGMAALKSLGRLTMRLSDPVLTPQGEAKATVATVLPYLLSDGVTSAVKEAQTACLGYVREVSKVAGPVLRPHMAQLAQVVLSALSSFEPEQLSYLQMHADSGSGMFGQDLPSGETLESVRLAAATRGGPLADVLDRIIAQVASMNAYELAGQALPAVAPVEGPAAAYLAKKAVDAAAMSSDAPPPPHTRSHHGSTTGATAGMQGERTDSMQVDGEVEGVKVEGGPLGELVDVLRTLVRSGVGLPTRGATARFTVSLTHAAGDAMAPHAGPLLRSLAVGLEDASGTLRKEFANAAACVARYARPAAFRKYLDRVLEVAGSSEASHRVTAGHAVLALAKHAGEQLQLYAPVIIPPAFLASLDPEESPRDVWRDVWEGVTGGGGQGQVRLHLGEIVQAIVGALGSSAWVMKRQGAAAVLELIRLLIRQGDGLATAALCATSPSSALPPALPAGHRPEQGLVYGPVHVGVGGEQQVAHSVRDILLQHSLPFLPPVCIDLRPHVTTLLPPFMAGIPGRPWEGKEDLLTALGALLCHVSPAFSTRDGDAGEPLEPYLRLLAAQCGRAAGGVHYVTAACTALARACMAYPGLDTWSIVAPAAGKVLARFARREAVAALGNHATGAGGTGTGGDAHAGGAGAAASEQQDVQMGGTQDAAAPRAVRLMGGRANEQKEGEERVAAREARAEEARACAAAALALAAAVPWDLHATAHAATECKDVHAVLRGVVAPEAWSSAVEHAVCTTVAGRSSQGAEDVVQVATAALLACYDAGDSAEDRLIVARSLCFILCKVHPCLSGRSTLPSLLPALLTRAEREEKYPLLRAALLGSVATVLQRAAVSCTPVRTFLPAVADVVSRAGAVSTASPIDPRVVEVAAALSAAGKRIP